ncbi:MAG: hypothetical protein HY928_03330 [Elusimicrobia bacterium]|nr:hypothetical protein [Elusimicrobiota bacterium]
MTNRSLRWLCLSVLFFAAPLTALEAPPAPPLGPVSVQAIPPGRDLAPAFSDPGRVGLLLDIVARVYNHRPLPFPKDGTVFANREGRLPAQPNGYYREYTVLPPNGSPDVVTVGNQTFRISPAQGRRGAERLIIGGEEFLYYSPDHYRTFIPLTVLR